MNKYRPLQENSKTKRSKAEGSKDLKSRNSHQKTRATSSVTPKLYHSHEQPFEVETGMNDRHNRTPTLTIQNRQRHSPVPRSKIAQIVRIFLKLEDVDCDEVDITFISDKEMRAMHLEFFDDPTPSDCISFPIDYDEAFGYKHLGEVLVCPEVASSYSSQKKLVYLDELVLYVIHGLLHLCGYDDLDPQSRKVMRKKEQYHMEYLRLLKLI